MAFPSIADLNASGLNPELCECEAEVQEVMRRVKPDERLMLEKELASLPYKEGWSIEKLCKALNGQDWQAPIFYNEECPYYALAALRLFRINPMQFATILFFWSIRKHEPIFVPLFNPDSTINEEARKYIEATLQATYTDVDQLFEIMRLFPPSEQQIFIIPDTNTERTVSRVINTEAMINVLSRAFGRRIVPSLGLMQALLMVRYRDDAVTLNPVLGLSSADDIVQNALNGTRDIVIPFPRIFLPPNADGYPAPDFDFSYHDYYHAYLLSSIPPTHRKLFIRIAQIMRTVAETLPKAERRALLKAAWSFKDQENSEYLPEYCGAQSINYTFWKSVARFLRHMDYHPEILPETRTRVFVAIGEELEIDPSIKKGPFEAHFYDVLETAEEVRAAKKLKASSKEIARLQLRASNQPLELICKVWKTRLSPAEAPDNKEIA